jgi:acyl-CoA synthetase (AMP-forming)/AMP-acid ligase II
MVLEATAFGVPHPALGQAIVLLAVAREGELDAAQLLKECQRRLPAYMVPAHVELREGQFPRNPNGKIDRKLLQQSFLTMFENVKP